MEIVKVGLQVIEKWNTDLEKAVQNYEAENAEKGQIVFYGPSNFTRWSTKYKMTPLREVLLGKSGAQCCVNRGFGSTCSEHHLYYYPRMVKALEPKVLVYAPGCGNGLSFGYTAEELFQLAARVVLYAKQDFPDLKIYLQGLNMWKYPERESYRKMDEWIKELAQQVPDCTYLDISTYEPLQRTDIYVADNVHYNQEGYQIYGEFYKEKLQKELDLF